LLDVCKRDSIPLEGADLPRRGAERADELFRVGFKRTKEYLLQGAEGLAQDATT
jgi:hypothetical protein